MSYTYCHLCTCEVKTVSSFLTYIPSAKSEACNDQRLLAFFKMHEDPDNGTIAHQSSSISSVQKGSYVPFISHVALKKLFICLIL